MQNYKGKAAGILGAIIIHLIAGIIFMIVQIGSLNEKAASEILVEFDNEEIIPINEKKTEQLPGTEEQYGIDKQTDEQISNIARNLAGQSDEKINVEDYIDKVKEELIQSGKLGKDNYIDEQKRNKESSDKGETDIENTGELPEIDKNNELEKMASNISGPTRIYYDLPGRYHTYLPIPIYKCEGSGKVTLTIEVNPIGTVVKAEIIAAESTTTDECLIETAINSVLISKFNPDANALKIQVGTLTYHFVAQ
jgi:hypothetical protein